VTDLACWLGIRLGGTSSLNVLAPFVFPPGFFLFLLLSLSNLCQPSSSIRDEPTLHGLGPSPLLLLSPSFRAGRDPFPLLLPLCPVRKISFFPTKDLPSRFEHFGREYSDEAARLDVTFLVPILTFLTGASQSRGMMFRFCFGSRHTVLRRFLSRERRSSIISSMGDREFCVLLALTC